VGEQPLRPADEMTSSLAAHSAHGETREESPAYRNVVVRFGSDWRVIECLQGIQWIIQRHGDLRSVAGGRWRSRGYYRSRMDLVVGLARLGVVVEADTRLALEALPEWIFISSRTMH
jgi:hypothetical protein